ncbi:hypothetical protein PVAG01_04139 [Phlyctema vagabunda]|uniref:Heterokaryon incompatibility domain-containing protein n=1 Tax=Phlyctema vagabunda TaxID=108571 RepID=A0ABR4PNF2_9HELO
MDHLPLPHEPAFGTINIPFLLTESYDGGDFLNFPSRHGWQIKGGVGKAHVTRDGNDASITEVGALLQTWACLGLASAFIGQKVDHDSMKGDQNGTLNFSSKALGAQVAAWSKDFMQQEASMCPDEMKIWRDERYNYLQRARHVTVQIMSTEKYRVLDVVCMSLAAIGEFLVQVIKDICFNSKIEQPMRLTWRVPPRVDCGQPILDLMQRNGWCPNKIAKLEASVSMPVGKLWYLANIAPPSTKDHSQCTVSACQHIQVERSTYKVAHQTSNCNCNSYGPPQDQVIDILDRGSIPVVSISNSSNNEMELQVEAENTGPYVAVSHVWADGHGNPFENKISACFLIFLGTLLQSLPGSPTRFWIDTLCVPLKPHVMRRKAITLLKDTYQRAEIVLVLDSHLMSLNSFVMDAVEMVARISCCGWAERLWTFQEGRLGRRVFFQFSDKAIDLHMAVDHGWRALFHRIPSTPSHSVELAILSHYTATRVFEDSTMKGMLTMLPHVRNSLCTRSTSNESDEAVCLANIMGLDVARVYDMPDADRMEAFWSQVDELPVGLAFSTAKRKLSQPGFRWAPASFMGELGNTTWSGPDVCSRDFSAHATNAGLVVRFPSFRLCTVPEAIPDQASSLDRVMDIVQATGTALPLQDVDGIYYNCTIDGAWHLEQHQPQGPHHLAIVVARHPVDVQVEGVPKHEYNPEWMEEGILVSFTAPIDGSEPLPAKVLCHVRLIKVGKSYQSLLAKQRECAERVLQDEGLHHQVFDPQAYSLQVAEFFRQETHLSHLLEGIAKFEKFEPSEEAFRNGVALLAWQWPWWSISVSATDVTWCLD